ncbi:MAG: metallophosphoesterase [Mogibacterium sp.]|nr:metallophosphoesterase [Mogibacterium sp.]
MFGKIFLVLYVIGQILISVLTEYSIKNHRFFSKIGGKTRIIRIFIYAFLAIVPVLGAYLPKSQFKYFCMGLGNVWLGFFIYYSIFVLLLFPVLQIIIKKREKEDKSLIGRAFQFAFLAALIIVVYGLVHAQQPKLVNYDVELANEAAKGEKAKIVLIADLHLSVNSDVKATEKMVELVNSCDPDIVVIAGDIFTSNFEGLKNPEKYSDAMSRMHAKYGVYAVCGNHDVDEDLIGGFSISPVSEAFRTPEMEKFFADSGFTVLYDESVDIGDGLFTLAGRIDGEKAGDGTSNRLSPEILLKDTDKSKPIVVLQHEPIEFKSLADSGADLVLCGHTHNGQIFPGNLVVPFFNENGYGVKELYGSATVVTAGVGYYGPPMRFGTDSEVTVVNVTFK